MCRCFLSKLFEEEALVPGDLRSRTHGIVRRSRVDMSQPCQNKPTVDRLRIHANETLSLRLFTSVKLKYTSPQVAAPGQFEDLHQVHSLVPRADWQQNSQKRSGTCPFLRRLLRSCQAHSRRQRLRHACINLGLEVWPESFCRHRLRLPFLTLRLYIYSAASSSTPGAECDHQPRSNS